MGICNIAQMRVFYIQSVMGAVTPGISDSPLEPQIHLGGSDWRLEHQIHPWIFKCGLEFRMHSWSLRSIVQPQMDSPLALEPHRSTPGVSDPPLEPQTPGSPHWYLDAPSRAHTRACIRAGGHRWYVCGEGVPPVAPLPPHTYTHLMLHGFWC